MQYIKAIIKKLNTYLKNSKHRDHWWKIKQKNSLFTIPQPPSFTKNDNQSETFIILGKHAVYLQQPRLCSYRKYPYTPTKDKGYSEGRGEGRPKGGDIRRGRRWHRLKYSALAFLTEIFFPGDIQPSGKIRGDGLWQVQRVGSSKQKCLRGIWIFSGNKHFTVRNQVAAFWKTCSHLTIARKNRAWRTVWRNVYLNKKNE